MKHYNHQEPGRKLEKYQFWFMVLRFLWTSPLFLWNSEQFSGFPQELECGGVRYFFLFLISATRSLLYINSAIVSASVCKQITLHLFNRLALLGEWMKHGWFTRQGNMLFQIYWCNTKVWWDQSINDARCTQPMKSQASFFKSAVWSDASLCFYISERCNNSFRC